MNWNKMDGVARGAGMGGRGFLLFLALLGAAGSLRAQETDDAASRAQALVDLLKMLEDGAPPPEGVLDGVELRTAPLEVRKIARVLRETRMDLALTGQDVPATIEVLRQVTGLNFVISPRARASLEEAKPEVTLTLRGLTAENVLNLLATYLKDYRFIIRYGALNLIKNEEHRRPTVLRFYDVSDLVRPRPDFPAPRLALSTGEDKN